MTDAARVMLARTRIQESVDTRTALLSEALLTQLAHAAGVMVEALRPGGKMLLFGNGGSAADATHLAAELVGRYMIDRPPLPALSLTDNGSSVTAIANDFDYEDVFARQVLAFGTAGDVAIGFSTSGASENVLRGLRAAHGLGMRTIAMTGANGGLMAEVAELCLRMPATSTARIQESYMLLGHTLCEIVERELFPDS